MIMLVAKQNKQNNSSTHAWWVELCIGGTVLSKVLLCDTRALV